MQKLSLSKSKWILKPVKTSSNREKISSASTINSSADRRLSMGIVQQSLQERLQLNSSTTTMGEHTGSTLLQENSAKNFIMVLTFLLFGYISLPLAGGKQYNFDYQNYIDIYNLVKNDKIIYLELLNNGYLSYFEVEVCMVKWNYYITIRTI